MSAIAFHEKAGRQTAQADTRVCQLPSRTTIYENNNLQKLIY